MKEMARSLSECDKAKQALFRLEHGSDTGLGSYTISENYPSSVEGTLVMVIIDAPSGESPQYSVLFLNPARKPFRMYFQKKEAGGEAKQKAFAVRYLDWDIRLDK
jgi:hypothetical protein